jgi:hypothetical protein
MEENLHQLAQEFILELEVFAKIVRQELTLEMLD